MPCTSLTRSKSRRLCCLGRRDGSCPLNLPQVHDHFSKRRAPAGNFCAPFHLRPGGAAACLSPSINCISVKRQRAGCPVVPPRPAGTPSHRVHESKVTSCSPYFPRVPLRQTSVRNARMAAFAHRLALSLRRTLATVADVTCASAGYPACQPLILDELPPAPLVPRAQGVLHVHQERWAQGDGPRPGRVDSPGDCSAPRRRS